ncbi:hypothetical protein [Bacillus altitudinis]|nr:hypothetical protein [Bacillus altitudinis]
MNENGDIGEEMIEQFKCYSVDGVDGMSGIGRGVSLLGLLDEE